MKYAIQITYESAKAHPFLRYLGEDEQHGDAWGRPGPFKKASLFNTPEEARARLAASGRTDAHVVAVTWAMAWYGNGEKVEPAAYYHRDGEMKTSRYRRLAKRYGSREEALALFDEYPYWREGYLHPGDKFGFRPVRLVRKVK